MTMLDILKARLPEDLYFITSTETGSKYKIVFQSGRVNGNCYCVGAELPKTCAPGCEIEVVDNTIKTAMAEVFMYRGDHKEAKAWLDGEHPLGAKLSLRHLCITYHMSNEQENAESCITLPMTAAEAYGLFGLYEKCEQPSTTSSFHAYMILTHLARMQGYEFDGIVHVEQDRDWLARGEAPLQ